MSIRQQIERLDALLSKAENSECFDCTSRQPRWLSINNGVFICIRCAGIHRSLGINISKVRSLTMDILDEETIQFMKNAGNGVGKRIFETNLPRNYHKPTDATPIQQLEKIIHDKWVRKIYATSQWKDLLESAKHRKSLGTKRNETQPSSKKAIPTEPPRDTQSEPRDLIGFSWNSKKSATPMTTVDDIFQSNGSDRKEVCMKSILAAFDSPL